VTPDQPTETPPARLSRRSPVPLHAQIEDELRRMMVLPEFQKTRVNYLLIRAMVSKLLQEEMEECRFCVEPGNDDARSVHRSLGARVVSEMDDYYHEGDKRLWSVITKEDLERIRGRYTRLRLVS